MARRKRPRPPISVALDRLEAKHTSGLDGDGKRWKVRGAAVGAVVEAKPQRKQTARLSRTLTPAPDAVAPRCEVFGICGGCQLQEMPLQRQREHKRKLVRRLVGIDDSEGVVVDDTVVVHPVRGAESGYAYRNKLELSWSPHRYIPEGVDRSTVETEGSFLGFHPPGWWSKVVPLTTCPLGSPTMQAVVAVVQGLQLAPAWNTRQHTGVWRHLVLRDGGTPDAPQVLVTFVTTSLVEPTQLQDAADAVAEVPGVTGVLHVVTDRHADVARGELRAVLHGSQTLSVTLGCATLQLPHDAFFQVNTEGAAVLVDTVAEALGLHTQPGGVLADLYCGVGALGLALSDRVDRILGIEEHAGAIACARENAARMGVDGEWHAGRLEDTLTVAAAGMGARPKLLVDPPRAGLHPRVAAFLAKVDAPVLVYVACGPKSLGRDRALLEAGGWRLTDLWTVDLFPQTHHIEAVARFVRTAP